MAMALELLLQQLWQELKNVPLSNPFLISAVFFISVIFFLHMFTSKGPILNLPPSPPKLPIIGNLHQLGTLPYRSLRTLSNSYGPVMFMNLGYTPAVIVTSAEIAKEMIKTHDIAFSNRPKTTGANILFYGCEGMTFSSYGEHWRQARTVCVHQLLSNKRVHFFQFVREEEVALIIERMRYLCRNGANSVNLTEILIGVSNNIISRCVLGKKFDQEEDGKNKLAELVRRIIVHLASVCFGDFFPYLGWVDVLTGLIPRMKKTFTEVDSYFDQVIAEHRISKSMDKDFVDILLQLQSDDLLDFVLTQNSLKAILLEMIIAGTETTSTTIEWIMAELIRNPTTLKKAQEEVRRVVDKKTKVDESDIQQMGYLKCVIKEALRLHCPLPMLFPRETSASVELGGYYVPPKTTVLINMWAIQRDSQVWGESAEEFIPERFENNSVDFKGQDFEFLPFGAGRRGCPGTSFGVAGIECVIANLLYWFDWALPDGISPENLDMSEAYSISAPKKVPLHLVPTLYSPF